MADLSHRLRTPLTALRLDAEALHDPVDAERVGNHVTQLERMLTAVIRAARRPQREGRMPSSDAPAVVRRSGRVLVGPRRGPGPHRLPCRSPAEPMPVRCSAEDLAAAVDALLENVIAHTPEGTDFAVTLEPFAAGARLTVSDEGPGLPDQRPRARPQRPRLKRPRPGHRPPVRRGVGRVDDAGFEPLRWRLHHVGTRGSLTSPSHA